MANGPQQRNSSNRIAIYNIYHDHSYEILMGYNSCTPSGFNQHNSTNYAYYFQDIKHIATSANTVAS